MPLRVGGVFVGEGLAAAAVTAIENAARSASALPSETLMMICEVVPTSFAVGIPVRSPDPVSNVAHAGLFWIAKVSASPSLSEALGWKEYGVPTITVVTGVPEIVGADAGVVAGAVSGKLAGPDEDPPLPPQPASPMSDSAHRT